MPVSLTLARCCAVSALLLLAACDSPQEREAEHLASGKALFESGDLSKAAIEFRNALQINPTGVEAKYFTALIYEKKGNLPRAIATFEDVALQDPNNRVVQHKLGQYALMNGDAAQARDRAEKVIALDSNRPDGHTMKAAALLMMGKLPEAETEARAALDLSPHDEDATIVLASQRARQGRFDQAEALVNEALAAKPDSVQLLGFRLKLLSDQKRAEEVEQVLRRLIALDPSNPAYVVDLTRHLTASGKLTEAREEFRRAVAGNKDSKPLLAAYAEFLEGQVGPDEAIEEAEDLAARYRGNALYSFLLARLYIKAGRLDDAASLLNRLVAELERTSDRLEAQVELARIAQLRGDKQGALDQLAAVLKVDSKNQSGLLLRAAIRLADSKFDQAIADARAVLSNAPASAPALGILAKAYAASNEQELAIGALRDLARVVPENAEVRTQLAGLLVTRAPEEALKQLDAAIALRPDDPELKAHKAQILIYTKRWDQGEVIGQELAANQQTVGLGHQILGEAALARQDFDTAITELQAAIDHGRSFSVVGPKLMEAFDRSRQPVAAARSGTDERSPAEQLLLERLEKDPQDADTLALLAAQREIKGDLRQAKDLLRKAIEARPGERQPYFDLARILKNEAAFKEASEVLQAAAARFPNDNLVQANLAISYELVGEFDAAKRTYEAVLAKRPDDVVAANNLAMLIADVWPNDKALLDRARALVEGFRNSNNPTLIDTLGWVQVRLGNIDDAAIILKKAATLQPDNQQVLYHYAVALSLKGLDDLARDAMAKALAGQPTFRGLEEARQLASTLR